MSQENSLHNRAVWFDIPVADLDRADSFYSAVLACSVDRVSMPGMSFSVLEHDKGNGGCLVLKPDEVASDRGILVYFNAEGRIRDAVAKAREHGGEVVEDTHSIGPHGFRAIVRDSEGNRIALHSESDA